MARKFARLDLSSKVEKWGKIYTYIFCLLKKSYVKERKTVTDVEPFSNEEMMVERQRNLQRRKLSRVPKIRQDRGDSIESS